MISVVGEALIDLAIEPDGSITAVAGGAPFNAARACGRLGAEVEFVGAVSVDRFGTMLAERLAADGVSTARMPRVDLPTTLAAAELDTGGAATYRFYSAGTSAPAYVGPAADLGGDVLLVGGLGLVLEPLATTVERLVAAQGPGCLVMLDVNCRPHAVADADAYAARVDRVVARSHVVKASVEDLAYLLPDHDPLSAAAVLVRRGARAVLVTAGGDGVRVVTAAGEQIVPVAPVAVVDTIGAGDAFVGGFLAWWVASGLGVAETDDVERLAAAVAAGATVAAMACTRRGADPPWRRELPADWST